MWYSKLEKTIISRHILHRHWYTCPIALPVRRNLQHRSLLSVVSATFTSSFQLPHLKNVCHISWPSCVPLYTTNTSYRKQETFLYEYPLQWVLLPTKNKRTTERCCLVVHSSRTVAILTTEASLWKCACYLDCLDAGLCYYLLRPLQLFYFHLCPIYWLSLVCLRNLWGRVVIIT
jgi:hypothetical protein